MKRLLAALSVLFLMVLAAPRASAENGAGTDPDDSPGKLDVLQVAHSDTADKITLTIDLYSAWKPADTPYYGFAWLFDFDNDGATDDGCVVVSKDDDANKDLAFALAKGNCDTGETSSLVLKEAGVATQPTTTSVSVTFSRANLTAAGQTGDSYKYLVNTFEGSSAVPSDVAPFSGAITHKLTPVTGPAATTSAATATPSSLTAGTTTVVTGSGFAPNAALKATLFSDPVVLGTFTADATGKYSVTVTIPANTLPGTHRIVVSGANSGGGTHESSATLTVVLPRTGSSATTRTAATGVAVLALGFAVLSLAYYERRVVSVGASRAADAISSAVDRFGV